MKQDQLEQHIKHALESIEPEVPTHLWNNIQAGISGGASSAPDPAGVSSQAASAGSGALLKIGAAAVVLLGGGMIIWQMNNESVESVQPVAQEQAEISKGNQKLTDQKLSGETPAAIAPVEREDKVQMEESTPVLDLVVSADENNHDATDEEIAQVDEASAAENTPAESVDVSEAEVAKTKVKGPANQGTQPVVTPPVVKPDSDNSRNAVAGQQAQMESDQPLETFVLVEVGILADKVSGEVPLTIKFSNMTEAYSYEWDFDNGRQRFEASPTMTFEEPGDYLVRLVVKDEHGNRMTDQMEITALDVSKLHVPDVITPNGDGLNDVFRVIGYNVSNLSFRIFRLDGSLVYEGSGQHDSWDGMDSQNPYADKYYVEVTAIKSSGEPIKPERKVLHVRRD